MKTSKTKKRFLLSLVAVIACVAMLVGTTMAWFTDSVTSGKNKIVAGNLDVELYAGGEKVTESTMLFNDVELWEPGAVAYETLTVKNVGTLALKYQMSLLFENETKVNGHGLSEALKVGTFEGSVDTETTREEVLGSVSKFESLASFTKTGELVANEEGTPVTYVVYWQPGDNDNLFNMNNDNQGEELSIDIGVNLVAGQDTVEEDSFDAQYDLSAFTQVNPENFETIIAGLTDGAQLYLQAGKYNVTANEKLKIEKNNVTIVGAGKDATIIDTGDKTCSGQGAMLISGDNVTLANLTVKTSSQDGNVSPVKVTDLSEGDGIVNNFKIENVALYGKEGHGLNIHGVKGAVINKVDIRSYKKCGISLAKATNVTITNTKTVAGGWADIGCMYKEEDAYNTPCSISVGAENDFGKGVIYSERPSSASGGKDEITFADQSAWVVTKTDAGISAVAAVAKVGNTGYASLEAAVNAASEEETVTILKNIALSSQLTISKAITLDGNRKTISGADDYTVPATDTGGKYLIGCSNAAATIKNMTLVGNSKAKFGLQFYKTDGGKVENVNMRNFDLGLCINASKVTATGSISQENISWGGINVSYGSNVTFYGTTFDASNATITGASSIYSDPADVLNANSHGGITIKPPTGWQNASAQGWLIYVPGTN